MTARRRYQVFNRTDGIWAAPFTMSRKEAEAFVRGFPERYGQQGYYRTASGRRIRPADVELELVRIDDK
ncbi:MAG: hypothetical protein QUS33_14135 [Dehalococcoidia bacterium]|nr:hypothetical protein [Dehalococcoidia bacterium]